jgi:hypothetical protein
MGDLFTNQNYVDIQTHFTKVDGYLVTLVEAQKVTTEILGKQDNTRDAQYNEIKALINDKAYQQLLRCGESQSSCQKNFLTKEVFYKGMAIMSIGIIGSFGFTSAVLWFVMKHIDSATKVIGG